MTRCQGIKIGNGITVERLADRTDGLGASCCFRHPFVGARFSVWNPGRSAKHILAEGRQGREVHRNIKRLSLAPDVFFDFFPHPGRKSAGLTERRIFHISRRPHPGASAR